MASAQSLERYLIEYRLQRRQKEELRLHEPIRAYGDWRDTIVNQWWNPWVREGWHEKRKQLFVWGASNAGKSTFIKDFILGNLRSDSIYTPIITTENSCSRYTWADFDERQHVVVLWDEFDINTVDLHSFKLCTEGSEFSTDIKYKKPKKIHLRMPMIFISQVFLSLFIYLSLSLSLNS